MSKYIITFLLILLLSIPGLAWEKKDTYKEAAYLTVHTMDWLQTRYIAKSDDFYELNPILGKYPSIGKVNTYFLITGIGHALVSYILPQKIRNFWQAITFILESGTVLRNIYMGVRFNLP